MWIKFLFFLFAFSVVFGQKNDTVQLKKNTVFVEVLGNSANLYSINYDRIIVALDKSYLNFSAGVNYLSLSKTDNNYSTNFPVLINLTTDKEKNSHFEVGVGLGLNYFVYHENNLIDREVSRLLFLSRIGYKYQQPQGGIMIKAALTPVFPLKYFTDFDRDVENGEEDHKNWRDLVLALHFFGISFGYTF